MSYDVASLAGKGIIPRAMPACLLGQGVGGPHLPPTNANGRAWPIRHGRAGARAVPLRRRRKWRSETDCTDKIDD